jgi:acyl carrier protein
MTTTKDAVDLNSGSVQPAAAMQIQTWLVDYLANALKFDRAEIDVTKTFEAYGLDSASAVGMAGDLGEWLGREIDPTLPYDYPTIAALAQRLAEVRQ